MPDDYKEIPITAARHIAKQYEKQQVIVVAWDAVHGKTHITTYGIDKEQCRQAAMGGQKVAAALGWPLPRCTMRAKSPHYDTCTRQQGHEGPCAHPLLPKCVCGALEDPSSMGHNPQCPRNGLD